MVQGVAHPLGLRAQISLVVLVGGVFDRYLCRDRQPVALQAPDLLRVVREYPDRAEPEVDEDLRADPVVAQVHGEPEALVRFDGVKALLLQPVGAQLVQQADAPALL